METKHAFDTRLIVRMHAGMHAERDKLALGLELSAGRSKASKRPYSSRPTRQALIIPLGPALLARHHRSTKIHEKYKKK